MGRIRRRAQVALAGMMLTVSPALAAPTGAGSTPAPVLKKKAGQEWWDWAGEQAREADALEKKGLHGEAEQARERVLHGLLLAWREKREPRALEPIVITLQRRLGRSTAAIEAALSFIYDIHQADKLTPEQEAQIGKLSAQVSLALRRLRREAKPGDAALCQEPMALRPGVLTLAGPLPGDDVLVLRDIDGGVGAVRCPPRVEAVPVVPPVVTCPKCPEPPPPPVVREAMSHWWYTAPGLGLLAVGGVMVGFGVDAHLTASDLADKLRSADGGTVEDAENQRRMEGWKLGLLTGGGVLVVAGIAGLIGGLSLAGETDASPDGVSVAVGPGGASLTLAF